MQDVLSTSEHPEPHCVLQPSSTTPQPSVLCSMSFPSEEDVMKFFIGLRLLGEVKTKRLLSYIQVLQQEQEQKEKQDEF